ncbi:MAG TPA: histidinol dehydrogenase [Burkholderiales bacterium]|nr:histidinol dehydrogenase [Burkholderiales bacterium]
MKIARRLSTAQADFERRLAELTAFEAAQDEAVDAAVARILADVKARGDEAVLDYTRRYDRATVDSMRDLEIAPSAMAEALERLPAALRAALDTAVHRVRNYHEKQRAESWRYVDELGNELGQQVTALDRVGLYVPGGKAAYPSSVIMNAVPAKVAGVREIVMVVPAPGGERNDLVLAAAALCGIDCAYSIGGAQAVAALAYGTQTIHRADKVVGPGNAYVAAAKRRVFGVVGIDMVAGPSEILVVCDGRTDPEWIAMDLFSQAEHDELAQAILISPDEKFLDAVERSIAQRLGEMPRHEVIAASLRGRGALIHVRDLDEACELVNRLAPEHLELSVEDPEALLPSIRHAGAIFMGRYASEALGDYCAGPNHVLPTSRTARFSSPLGVYDFQKRSSIIKVSATGAAALGPVTSVLAQGEGLQAHARSAELRFRK